MSIEKTVIAICQCTDDSLIASKAKGWESCSESECKSIISTVKKVIKSRESPAAKLLALKVICRQLHHCCMLNRNPHYLRFSETKIMRRLQILAEHNKTKKDLERGADIFGKKYASNEATRRTCIEFHLTLLNCIRIWATAFGMRANREISEFLKTYTNLTNLQVEFPPLPQPSKPQPAPKVPPSPSHSDILTHAELDEAANSVQLMQELLAAPGENEELLAHLSETLQKFLPKAKRELNVQSSQAGIEQIRERIIQVTCDARNVLKQFDEWKNDRRRVMREPPQSPRSPNEKKETLQELEMELAELKRKMAEFDEEHAQQEVLSLRIAEETDKKLVEAARKFADELKRAKAKAGSGVSAANEKLSALASELAAAQKDVKEKEEALHAINKAIGAAQEENRRLKEDLRAAMDGRQESFAEVRRAVNEFLWPTILESDKGLLFSDAEVEVGYWVRSPAVFQLYLGNKSGQRLSDLTFSVSSCAALSLQLNKEAEERPLEAGAKAIRGIACSVLDIFSEIPKLAISYRCAEEEKKFELLLPLYIFRYLAAVDPETDVAALWTSLADCEEQSPLPAGKLWFGRFLSQTAVGKLAVLCGTFREEIICLGVLESTVFCRSRNAGLRSAALKTVNCVVLR